MIRKLDSRERCLLAISFAVIGLVGVVGVLAYLDSSSKQTPEEIPVLIAPFEDGVKLEILGLSIGRRMVQSPDPSPDRLPKFSKSTGTSTYLLGEFEVLRDTENNRVVRSQARTGNPAALLMEMRLTDQANLPLSIPAYLTESGAVFQDRRLSGTLGPVQFFKLTDDSISTTRDAMLKAGLQVLVEYRDPVSGWIPLRGPYLFNESWKNRTMVTLAAWQRDLAILEFRVVRDTGPVASFSLPNPDLRKPVRVAGAKSLPFTVKGSDFSLTFHTIERFGQSGDHPFSSVGMILELNGKPVELDGNSVVRLLESALQAEDEWGNVVSFRRENIRNEPRFGAFLPATSKQMKVKLTIGRTQDYPRFDTTGAQVMEGTVNPDGVSVDFKLLPEAAVFGIRTAPKGTIVAATPRSGEDGSARKGLKIAVEGEGESNDLPGLENRLGEIGDWQCLIFPAASNQSAGSFESIGSGHGRGGNQFHFSSRFIWSAPAALLQPGARVRLGIHAPLPSESLNLVFDLPSTILPR